ncbi:MAG: response regulator transcription factor [Taibaiella sp.]|jgi:DNA-binding NarL/FixJ family response regulator
MISVLIVEDQLDHQIYLNTIVSSDAELKCLGIIRNGNEAIKEIIAQKPDIVLMDIGLPDMSGIECILKLRPKVPEVKFMVCTVYEEDESIFEALKAGAHSYIVKRSKPYQILDAIKELYNGERPISSCIAKKILNALPKETDNGPARLEYKITSKQEDILKFLAKGYSYQEIADKCFISPKTLKWHVHNIYKKLHADNRMEAVNKYFKKY